MAVTLIHNEAAGGGASLVRDELVAHVEGLGWKVKVATGRDLDVALRKPGEAVLVAGGDGTIGKVAKRLAGSTIPVGIIPTGTANNVARSLGVGVDARSAIESLGRAVVRRVDLGVAHTGGEPQRFLEGLGVGVFAWVMAERARKEHKGLRRAFTLLADHLETFAPSRVHLEIDGTKQSGEVILAAIMNLRSVGPALGLAPDAAFDDGLLDVVLVRTEDRASLLAHLRRAAREGDVPLPRFEVHRGEHVRLKAHDSQWAHIDDHAHELDRAIDVRAESGAVDFLLPAPTSRA